MTIFLTILIGAVWVSCWLFAVRTLTMIDDMKFSECLTILVLAPLFAIGCFIVLLHRDPIVFRRRKDKIK